MKLVPLAAQYAKRFGKHIRLVRFARAEVIQEFKPVAPPPSITCPHCQMVSYNPNDIEHRYCGFCHRFLDDITRTPPGTA